MNSQQTTNSCMYVYIVTVLSSIFLFKRFYVLPVPKNHPTQCKKSSFMNDEMNVVECKLPKQYIQCGGMTHHWTVHSDKHCSISYQDVRTRCIFEGCIGCHKTQAPSPEADAINTFETEISMPKIQQLWALTTC